MGARGPADASRWINVDAEHVYHVQGGELGDLVEVQPEYAHIIHVQGEIRKAPRVVPIRALRPLGGSPAPEEPPFETGLVDQVGFARCCPLSDVEPLDLMEVPSTSIREEFVAKARELWVEEAGSPKMGAQPLPPLVNCDNVREFLKAAQAECHELRLVLLQKRAELDPEMDLKRKTGPRYGPV